MVTTTITRTDLVTFVSTYSVPLAAAPTPTSNGMVCNVNLNQFLCGSTCCVYGQQFCQSGQCAPIGGSTGGAIVPAPTFSSVSNSAFIRPTSNTIQTVTQTASASTTMPFQSPVATDGGNLAPVPVTSGGGLSGGAIAGIVIGVLLGLLLLFLICACLCCKSILDGILALFGIGGKKKRTEETYIETHHSHHSGHGAAPPPRRWFGMRPGRAEKPPKKSSGVGGLLGVGGALAALAIVLGLKRRSDKKSEKSEYTGSSYSYSDYTTSESKF